MEPLEMMEASVPKKPFLTPEEVSQLSGLAVQTLAAKRTNGIPPDYIRAGGSRVRYPRVVIVQWLADEYVKTHATMKPGSGRRRR
jgi:predicted DNA-binding transcriptional regulator AlpA